MIPHRYTLPALIAAALHVALFLGFPEETFVRASPPEALIPWPDRPADTAVIRAPEPDEVPVKPVRPVQAAATPVLPEPDLAPKNGWQQPLVDLAPVRRDNSTSVIPTAFNPAASLIGDEEGLFGPGNIFDPTKLDRVPRAKWQGPPNYPSAMQHGGITGFVVVEFDVNREGRVIRAEALNWSRPEFVEPALRAVRGWSFEPGRRHGRPVSFRMIVPIKFDLNRP